jgi:PAS domain S-box-containing protein
VSEKPCRVLLVEDEVSHAELVQETFEEAARLYIVTWANTLEKARAALAKASFDVVLVDWRLPDGDGLDLLPGGIEQACMPFVMMTSHGDERLVVEAMRQGALNYVVKDPDTLTAMDGVAENALREWRHVEQKMAAEAALKEGEIRYRELYDRMSSGVIVFQYDETTGCFMIQDMNRSGERIVQLEREAVQGKEELSVFPGMKSSGLLDAFHRAHQTGQPETLPTLFYEDGRISIWVKVYVYKLPSAEIVAVFDDVTQGHRQEEERIRLATAIEQSSDAMVVLDAGKRVLYVNPAYEAITGYAKEEVLDRLFLFLEMGEQDAGFHARIWETVNRGKTWRGRLSNKTKKGTLFTEALTISPVHDSLGTLTNYIVTCQDVTHEEELERQLLHAQKMEAIGTLAGGVAHDFNNVLQVISSCTEIAAENASVGKNVEEELAEIAIASDRATSLVRQLLTFSRKESLELQQCELHELVQGLFKMIHRIIGEHIELGFRLEAARCRVNVDSGQIEQLLVNLCINARDAMTDGGSLSIDTHEKALRPGDHPHNLEFEGGEYIVLRISDTGTGIAPEISEHIFEPFFSTKAPGEGTGLGLSMVYSIAERHGGFVTLDSEQDQGAAFNVFLPLCVEQQETREKENTPGKPMLSGKGEVLLFAEDNEQVRNLVTQILTRAGYEVIVASDGEEAIQRLDEHANRIQLALLDVVMPKKSGHAVYEHIVEENLQLPVIFASGYDFNLLSPSYLPDGKFELLNKPYRREKLLLTIRELLDIAAVSQ